jgi:hypothetical protein
MKRVVGKKNKFVLILSIIVLALAVLGLVWKFGITGNAAKNIPKCSDSDGGLNYDVKGIASYKNNNYFDRCINKNQLIEYYCKNDKIASYYYKCIRGCKEGVCVKLEYDNTICKAFSNFFESIYGINCTNKKYDKRADLNEDGKIDSIDRDILKLDNESWCYNRFLTVFDACPTHCINNYSGTCTAFVLSDYSPKKVRIPIELKKNLEKNKITEFDFTKDLILKIKLLDYNKDNITIKKDLTYQGSYLKRNVLLPNPDYNHFYPITNRLRDESFILDDYAVNPIETLDFNKDYSIYDLQNGIEAEKYGIPVKSIPTTKGLIFVNLTKKKTRIIAEVKFCLNDKGKATAIGTKKILFVPIYLNGVFDKVIFHEELKNQMYLPSFSDINNYLKIKSKEFTGDEIFSINFTISEPLLIDLDSLENNMLNAPNIIPFIRNKIKYNLSQYDIIVFRTYDSDEHMTEIIRRSIGNYPFPFERNFAVYGDIPIAIVNGGIEYPDEIPQVTRQNQNDYTFIMLHEILHTLGASETMYTAGALFFIGENYTGQNLIDLSSNIAYNSMGEIVDGINMIGQFQNIDFSIAQQIGWIDSNENGVLDVREFC